MILLQDCATGAQLLQIYFDCLEVRDVPDLRLPLHSADSILIKIPTAQTLKALHTNSWERGLLGGLPKRSPCTA